MIIRLGLPIPGGKLAAAARDLGAPVLVSSNAFAKRVGQEEAERLAAKFGRRDRRALTAGTFRGFREPSADLQGLDVALDSAGFVAMARYNGFDWDAWAYVGQLVARGRWTWWSQMDCCVEEEVAGDRTTVRMRLAETARHYRECLAAAAAFGVAAPMPVLQGRTPDDYAYMADRHPAGADWPSLVGVGSMCRRVTRGPEGLLAVVERLDRVLPAHVQLHLFGVKGDALGPLLREAAFGARIASIDSCAWDAEARRKYPTGRTMDVRIPIMRRWYATQAATAAKAAASSQLGFGLLGGAGAEAGATAAPAGAPVSSCHPRDAADPLLERYLDLVAENEIEMGFADYCYRYDDAFGLDFGEPPLPTEAPDPATIQPTRDYAGTGWVHATRPDGQVIERDELFHTVAEYETFLRSVEAAHARGTVFTLVYADLHRVEEPRRSARWADGAWAETHLPALPEPAWMRYRPFDERAAELPRGEGACDATAADQDGAPTTSSASAAGVTALRASVGAADARAAVALPLFDLPLFGAGAGGAPAVAA